MKIDPKPGYVTMSDTSLSALSGLVNLRSLSIRCEGVDGSGLAPLSGCEELQYVDVNCPRITRSIVEGLAALPGLTAVDFSLTEIDADVGNAFDAYLARLGPAAPVKSLE